MFIFSFFFSSRRRHTRLQGDWSSDVCSSDLDSEATLSKLTARAKDIAAALLSLGAAISSTTAYAQETLIDLIRTGQRAAEIGRASCRERVKSGVGGGDTEGKKTDTERIWESR